MITGRVICGNDGLHVGLVQTEHRRAVKRDAVHELRENRLNLLERGVMVQMLAIDRGHHGDDRREQKERAVALVRFHNHIFAAAQAGRGPGVVDASAHDEGRVQAGRAQDCGY